jgi:hypothetical protein
MLLACGQGAWQEWLACNAQAFACRVCKALHMRHSSSEQAWGGELLDTAPAGGWVGDMYACVHVCMSVESQNV